jgi:hypothetical protein
MQAKETNERSEKALLHKRPMKGAKKPFFNGLSLLGRPALRQHVVKRDLI